MRCCFFLILITVFCFSIGMNEVNGEEVYKWNFKPSENNEPSDTEPEYKELLEKYDGLFIGDPEKKDVYLTFDNGYENGYTEDILDVLKEKQIPAAFFVTGHYLESASDTVKRMVKEGHTVGNHSWNHPSLPEISDKKIEEELGSVKEEFQELTGEKDMLYLRPPQGTFNESSLAKTRELGYINVFWSFAYVDWETSHQKGAEHAYQRIMKRIHPGAVMLLHSVSEDNAKALEKVIDEAQKQGYTFKNLDDLVLDTELTTE
ncbi:delta-lactam-biosynthetic de-N-acetylase [Salibacterium salarium]|uniref:Delta-lactam-biosynthetic de-N-acetylase n=1 Tax=Salibacterium salarium TaxID=284579 RepID=A0A3R9QKQ8_9BACI|nr:delta-lactam-biosynthetic de-N-acetylase [Salibacterium salarium]